jgi:hypothetical protein
MVQGDSSRDREQVNVKLSPAQRDRWDRFVNESPEVDNLSHLVRSSVERRISATDPDSVDAHGAATPTGAGVGASADMLADVLEAAQRIEAAVESVGEDVDGVREGVEALRDRIERKQRLRRAVPENRWRMVDGEPRFRDRRFLSLSDAAQIANRAKRDVEPLMEEIEDEEHVIRTDDGWFEPVYAARLGPEPSQESDYRHRIPEAEDVIEAGEQL